MKKVFGEKRKDSNYEWRKGVYGVILNTTNDKVMTVHNGKGHHFLPGGGIEGDETHLGCLEREIIEETGYRACVDSYIGNAMRYFQSTTGEPLISDGYFYLADLLVKMQEPTEEDHYVEWISVKHAKHLLVHEHHYWAVNEGLRLGMRDDCNLSTKGGNEYGNNEYHSKNSIQRTCFYCLFCLASVYICKGY
ncbi:NUDIX hydrolase [Lysinibacillus sphaericus]